MTIALVLRCIAASLVFRLSHSALSLAHIPDGPVGLPSNVLLRTEKFHRRRHADDPHVSTSVLPSVHIDSEVKAEIATSNHLLTEMKDQYKEDEMQGVLKEPDPGHTISLEKLIPAYIQYLPSNMMSAKRYIMDTSSTLLKLGLQTLLSSQVFRNIVCKPTSNEAELLICVTDAVTNISRIIKIGASILTLNYRILAGGQMGEEALVRLNTLAANPQNKTLMKLLGSTAVLYITLMREAVPDETKGLAGSIMTELTSLPVISNIPDTASGGFGRVNVVIPRPSRTNRADYDIAKLRAGASERDLLTMNM